MAKEVHPCEFSTPAQSTGLGGGGGFGIQGGTLSLVLTHNLVTV